VRLCSAGTMIDVPRRLWRGAAVVFLQLAWIAPPATASAQTAQAVRVPHDSGGTPASSGASGSSEHRYGPPESVRERDAQLEASVPTRYAPPAGMCRVWVGGVPPERQPAPTECAKAIRVRSPNSHVVFGKPRPAVEEGPAETNLGLPGLAPGGHDTAVPSEHAQLPADGHTTGSVAPVHQPATGESGPPPAPAPAAKPAPAATGSAATHAPARPRPSPPPKVTARPRR
jgi:hypothetical protein